MSIVVILAFASPAFCAVLALVVLFRDPRSAAHWSFAVGMLGLSAESTFSGLSLVNLGEPERMIHWQNLRLMAMSSLPSAWLLFSLTYSRGNYREFIKKWRLALAAVLVIPILLAGAFWESLITAIRHITPTGQDHLALGVPGLVLNLIFLVSSVMILMNLERTFRASVGTMRWRIKYLVMGLGLLFAVRIYTSSQYHLFSAISLSLEGLNAVALLLASLLIALSLRRAGHFNVDIYPSRTLLHSSLALLLTGIYLLLVGVLAKVVTLLGGDAAFPLKAFFVLASLIGLTILLLSERVRQYASRVISRHLKRPHYDYRAVWLSFTRLTASIMHGSTLSRAVAKWVSETFQVLSVDIWLVDDSSEHLIYGASTSFPEAEIGKRLKVLIGAGGTLALSRRPYPFDVNETKEKCLEALKLHNPDAFRNRGCRVCVPMIASGELLGLMIVGDRVNGTPFSAEDMDLLKCIGDQVAGDLLNIRLSENLLQAKEMEAFQTMSAFFVHDLKNTVFTLSLLLENLPEHFEKPEFRGDMLRALAKCVSRINHLISRLGLLRHELELKRTEADLNDVVGKALASLEGLLQVQVTSHLRPIPNLSIDPEQIQKVINNLLVNAIEAVGKTGLVHVETSTRNGWIQLSVKDNGCGMSPEFVAGSLFRPFQTTKKRGIGIGMFLSKMIVDAHEGRVEVESHIGKGTTFHLLLPLQGAPN